MMEATKRERIILYGAVPIAAAIIGAIVTAMITHKSGDAANAASIAQIAIDKTMTAPEKLKALELINKNDQQFYDLIRSLFTFLLVPITAIAWAVADWIKRR